MLKRKILIPVAAIMAMSGSVNASPQESELNSEFKEITYKIAKVKPKVGLNVRKTPEVKDENKIFAATKGTELEIVGQENNWYKVELEEDEFGWVNSNYVDVKNEAIYVDTDRLNFREDKSLDSNIHEVLNRGDQVELLEESEDWLKVNFEDKEGYVHSKYITDEKPEVEVKKVESITKVESSTEVESDNDTQTDESNNTKVEENKSEESNNTQTNDLSNTDKPNTNQGSTNNTVEENVTTENSTTSSSKQSAIVNLANAQLGKPYVWGAEGPNSFDCSGLTSYVYKNAAGISLPRNSSSQSTYGTTVNHSNLQPGDLIYFSTNGSGNVSHVGIYVGNGEMIHSPKPGSIVQKSNINISYWNNAYLWAKRVL